MKNVTEDIQAPGTAKMMNATLLNEPLIVRPLTSQPTVSLVGLHFPSRNAGCSPRSTIALCMLATVNWLRSELRRIFPK
jgi:hypothetical protein